MPSIYREGAKVSFGVQRRNKKDDVLADGLGDAEPRVSDGSNIPPHSRVVVPLTKVEVLVIYQDRLLVGKTSTRRTYYVK